MTQSPHKHGSYIDADSTQSERDYATFNHLVGLLSVLDHTILGLIGVIIMWRIRAKDSPFLDDHGREALNFQLSMLLYVFIAIVFTIITFGLGVLVLIPVVIFLWILRLVAGIRGAMAAHRGEYYRYPMCIRFF